MRLYYGMTVAEELFLVQGIEGLGLLVNLMNR